MLKSSTRSDHRPAPARSAVRRISPANSTAEREADSAARRVMNGGSQACACGGGCPRCTPAASHGDGRGRPLDPATRAFFEPRFGQNLGGVRVLDDATAARSARALGAKAYTAGSDIVFARGRYAPDRPAGRELLAHELAHVVLHGEQAAAGTIFRSKETAAESEAEIRRIYDEMMKLAAKNAWSGVDRNYKIIEQMGPDAFTVAPNPANLHFLGSEASRMLGDTASQHARLQLAQAALSGAEDAESVAQRTQIEGSVGAINQTYGTVTIEPLSGGNAKKQAKKAAKPILVRPEMPFARDQSNSVEYAVRVLDETGEFSGLLPAGDYLLDGKAITVVAGGLHSFAWGD